MEILWFSQWNSETVVLANVLKDQQKKKMTLYEFEVYKTHTKILGMLYQVHIMLHLLAVLFLL